MQSPSLNTYADYATKIVPTSKSSCQTLWQTPLLRNRKSPRNFSIVTTTSIFDSALELEKSKGCRLLQIFARNTKCCQSERASLAWCRTSQHNRAPHSAIDVGN